MTDETIGGAVRDVWEAFAVVRAELVACQEREARANAGWDQALTALGKAQQREQAIRALIANLNAFPKIAIQLEAILAGTDAQTPQEP